jgi:tRNA pseudouridine38-40 synthase
MRIALGLSYLGLDYEGWQSQPNGRTIQDQLEKALLEFTQHRIRVHCAGRTDSGVHALQQVVHFDTPVARDTASWVRGLNTFLPKDIAVQWAIPVEDEFDARRFAVARKYIYLLLDSPIRPSIDQGRVGWYHYPLNEAHMKESVNCLLGTHDFSSFRAAACQSLSPIKTLYKIEIVKVAEQLPISNQTRSTFWRFEFEGNAFLHHMIRNIMGCLVYIGQGKKSPAWMHEVLLAKNRDIAAPTFSPDGLYFAGPQYDPKWGVPGAPSSIHWPLC